MSESDNDLVSINCPQCAQLIRFARDQSDVDIGCPQCGVGIHLANKTRLFDVSGMYSSLTHMSDY